MSWSITFIGKPENVVKAIQEQSVKLDGQSKVEYDDAVPHMIGLVNQNFGNHESQLIRLVANGHGYIDHGVQKQRNFTMTLELLYGVVV